MSDIFDTMTVEDARELLRQVSRDHHTGFVSGNFAATMFPMIPDGKIAIFVDFGNVHGCNHRYTMSGTNQRWVNSFIEAGTREEDIVIKWGGDEIIAFIDKNDALGFIGRFVSAMRGNDVYAVVVACYNTTQRETTTVIGLADTVVSEVKAYLEKTGQKPGRNEPYRCLESIVKVI